MNYVKKERGCCVFVRREVAILTGTVARIDGNGNWRASGGLNVLFQSGFWSPVAVADWTLNLSWTSAKCQPYLP